MNTYNKYVGARYVPKHCGVWDSTKNSSYESLSVVLWEGASYTSRQDVPQGVDILNTMFWVLSADYNAQLAIYEQNVKDYYKYVIEQIGLINDSIKEQFNNIVNQIPSKTKTISDNNVLYTRALKDISNNIPLSYFKSVVNALNNGNLRICFVGDSITEGIDQVTEDDKYASKLVNALRKALPNITIIPTNFGLNGRTIGQFNSDTYVATPSETNTSTNFTRSWSVVGKSWKEHVKDFNPDIIVFAFGMNDCGTNIHANVDEYNNLLTAKSYFDSFNKKPDIVLIPTYLPTKDQNNGEVPWFSQTQEATIAVSRATREFGKQFNIPIIDVNRLFTILRDGVDSDGYYGYVDGLTDNMVHDTSQFNIVGNSINANANSTINSKIYAEDNEFYNGDIKFTATLEPSSNDTGTIQLFYRWKSDRGGYLFQLAPNSNGSFLANLYSFNGDLFNGGISKAYHAIDNAITVTKSVSVDIIVRGSHQMIYVDGNCIIDIYDYDHLSNGYVGISTSGHSTGIIKDLTCVYFKEFATNIGLYTEDELLGVNYSGDPQSGNAINHLSGLGYSMVYEPILLSLSEKIGMLTSVKNKIYEVCEASNFSNIVNGNLYWDTSTSDNVNIIYYIINKKQFNSTDKVSCLDLSSFKPFNMNTSILDGHQLHNLGVGEFAYLKSQPNDNIGLIFIREDDKPSGKMLININ